MMHAKKILLVPQETHERRGKPPLLLKNNGLSTKRGEHYHTRLLACQTTDQREHWQDATSIPYPFWVEYGVAFR